MTKIEISGFALVAYLAGRLQRVAVKLLVLMFTKHLQILFSLSV